MAMMQVPNHVMVSPYRLPQFSELQLSQTPRCSCIRRAFWESRLKLGGSRLKQLLSKAHPQCPGLRHAGGPRVATGRDSLRFCHGVDKSPLKPLRPIGAYLEAIGAHWGLSGLPLEGAPINPMIL